MNEQKPPRNGRDFAIGLVGSLIFAIPAVILMISQKIGQELLIGLIAILILISITSFICHRKFIGIGILAAFVATPLLLIGSCFALVAIN